MGMHHRSVTGYGLIVMATDDDYDEEDFVLPDEIVMEPVGDYVLGEEEATFYMVKDADVTFSTSSAKDVNGWITAYTDYQVNKMPKGIKKWLRELQAREEHPTMMGFFTTSVYI